MRAPADRPYRSAPRRGGSTGPLVFALAILALGIVVIGIARPIVADAFVGLAEDRPGLLRNAAARDLVRSALGDAAARPNVAGAASETFVVEHGDTSGTVARRLADEGIVARPAVFLLALFDLGEEETLQAGTYRVSAAMTPSDLARIFQRAPGEQLVLRLIEGWRLSEIAAEVQKRFPRISAADFAAAAVAGRYDYDFLKGVKEGTPLEGFLFPDTYFFSPEVTAADIVRTLLDTFEHRAGAVVVRAASARNVRPADVVAIASIVEREAKVSTEAPTIASVYWNRFAIGMALEADPTVQYALGDWREPTLDDLKTDSPYNTYLNPGLPPTPIAAPGTAALEGAAEPAQTDYFYFVAKNDGTGEHAFAKTLEEHEANRVKYGNR